MSRASAPGAGRQSPVLRRAAADADAGPKEDDRMRSAPRHPAGKDGSEDARRAADWLAGGKLRPTRQRLALAKLLIGDGRNRHVTAESLHDAARASGDPVSLATVYNTLRAFCEAGLLNEVTVDGSRSYFDTRVDDHIHYYWEDDGLLSDAPNDAVRLQRHPVPPPGAEVARVDVVIRLRRTRT
jgi:Fur family transcriptional regulator, iron response regulator